MIDMLGNGDWFTGCLILLYLLHRLLNVEWWLCDVNWRLLELQ